LSAFMLTSWSVFKLYRLRQRAPGRAITPELD
jgi:hypothetical protein